MTTPKQSKDVDSSQGYIPDPDEPYSDFADEDTSSLREQIEQVILDAIDAAEGGDMLLDVKESSADQILSLVTTYIEAAEIDRALLELELARESGGLRAGYYRGRKERLQAQKAVLEEK